MTSVARAAICVLAIASASDANADDSMAKPKSAVAQERLANGNKLYRLREFEKAVDEYKAGSLAEDAPVFHYNLGQCYRQLGRFRDAVWHYERFIERGKPTGQIRQAVDGFVTEMKAELAKQPAPPKPDPVLKAVEPPKVVTRRVRGEPWYRDRLGWTLSISGAVATGIGGWMLLDARNLDADANGQATQSRLQDLRERAHDRRVLGSVVGVAGVGLLVAGLVKLALRPGDREERVPAGLTFGVADRGLFVAGRF